jgi:hypothetical protein
VIPKDFEAAFQEIRGIVEYSIREKTNLEELARSGLSPAQEEDLRADLRKRIEERRQRCREELRSLLAFPPHHLRHFGLLEQFWHEGSYERSVFLMTKFPDTGDGTKADQLQQVIDVVTAAVGTAGFVPRIAQFPNLHPGLWDNVELHLLGCRQGIAIVEDQYLPELNPNVAMEWGWMRGMGKPVLFLAEEKFKHHRADLGDLLNQRFVWANPQPGIDAAVGPWLQQIERELTGTSR